jgi:hypothetical protein
LGTPVNQDLSIIIDHFAVGVTTPNAVANVEG